MHPRLTLLIGNEGMVPVLAEAANPREDGLLLVTPMKSVPGSQDAA